MVMKTICLYSLLALLPLVPVAAGEVKRLPGDAEVSGVDIRKQRESVLPFLYKTRMAHRHFFTLSMCHSNYTQRTIVISSISLWMPAYLSMMNNT